MKPRPFTAEETNRLMELYADGWTLRRIAAELNRNVSSVGDKIRRVAAESYSDDEDDDSVCTFQFDDEAFDRAEGLV